MERLEVLISGAGIAGCTLAYWLTRNGHSVTAVERSGSLRSSGSPVDVRGPAVDVAERMNIATRIREASIRLKGMSLLDSGGRRVHAGRIQSRLRMPGGGRSNATRLPQ
jgi:2-polyprenyl-6-methoxyphenol hydroxylase-like FAD-dependent oxidoreductase